MQKLIMLFVAMLFYQLQLVAQSEFKITGTITAKEDGQAVAGATIVPNGNMAAALMSDSEGKFQITTSRKLGKLKFSSIGFKTLEVNYDGSQILNVVLEADNNLLDEVVLIGYGESSKKRLTGSIDNANLANSFERGVKNADELLQGQIAGVTVMNSGGDPTSTPNILVRGIASPSYNEPLIILDGIPYDGGLNSINTEDIETMSVVKDAAASIYGARGTTGVILINTKKGKAGRFQIELNTSYGIKQPRNLLYSLNSEDFSDYRNLASDNAGVSRDPAFDVSKNPIARTTRTNWIDEIFRTGAMSKHNISFAYGNEKVKTYTSFGYLNEKGILLNTNFERFSGKLNVDYEIHKKLKVGTRLNYAFFNGNGANTTSAYTGSIFTALSYPSSALAYDPQSPTGYGGIASAEFAGSYGDLINPVAELQRRDETFPTNDLFGVANIQYEIIKDLTYRFNVSANLNTENYKRFDTKILEIGKIFNQNYLTEKSINTKRIVSEHVLEYHKYLNSNHFSVLLGHSRQKDNYNLTQIQGSGFNSELPEHRFLTNAQNIERSATLGTANDRMLISYFSRFSYDYNNKYFFNAILRRDGSSKLSKGNRFGFFPSFLGAWIISNESFYSLNAINFLKIRGSWGQQGNEAVLNPYEVHSTLSRLDALIGGNLQQGFIINKIVNSNLKWEISEQTNLGLDIELLNNKLSVSADYYIKESKDFLYNIRLPATSGISSFYTVNAGDVKNKGFELALGYSGKKGDLDYTLNATAATNKNKVQSIYQDVQFVEANDNVRTVLYPVRFQVGYPVYSYFGHRVSGIFQSAEEIKAYTNSEGAMLQPNAKPGDFKFINTNGDEAINDKDKVYLGDPYPDFTYSLTGNLYFKNFDFSMFLQAVGGVQAVNGLKLSGYNAALQGYNMMEAIKDAWSPTNTDGEIPIVSLKDNNKNFSTFSDFYVEDADYLRIKNVVIGYTLPGDLTKKINIAKLRIYGSVDNLATFTKYSGFDPEVGVDRKGIDIGRYPQSRTILLGINVSF